MMSRSVPWLIDPNEHDLSSCMSRHCQLLRLVGAMVQSDRNMPISKTSKIKFMRVPSNRAFVDACAQSRKARFKTNIASPARH